MNTWIMVFHSQEISRFLKKQVTIERTQRMSRGRDANGLRDCSLPLPGELFLEQCFSALLTLSPP